MNEEKLAEIWKMSDEEIDTLIKGMTEQEKDDYIKYLIMFCKKSWQLYLSVNNANKQIIKLQDLAIEKSDIIIDDLLERLNREKIDVLNKEDIIRIFKWEDQKARAFLKMAVQMNYASKINKNIIITKKNLEEYLQFLRGKDLAI